MRNTFRSFWSWLIQLLGLSAQGQALDRQQALLAQDQKIQQAEQELDTLYRELDNHKRKLATIHEPHLRLQHARRIDALNKKLSLKNAQINRLSCSIRVLQDTGDLEELIASGGIVLPTAEETMDRVALVREKTRDLIESASLLDEGLTGVYDSMEFQNEQQRLEQILADNDTTRMSAQVVPAAVAPVAAVSESANCNSKSTSVFKRPMTA